MARVTLKSQAIVIAQLEAQVAELTTQVGVLMNQLEASNQARAALQDERDTLAMVSVEVPDAIQESYATLVDERNELIAENQRLTESCVAAHERCDALEVIVAAQPKSVPPASPKKPSPKPQVPAPVASAEAQEAMARFMKLTPAQRSAVVKYSGFKVVNLGNILECQAKWHSRKSA